jgi:hypothetical protein
MANVEHSTLTGSDLHESKGVATAANNRVYVSNGAGSGSWTTVPAAAITAAGVLVFQSQFYHIRDERSSGTAGDTMTVSTWNTRPLNTEKSDDLGITPASNQLSLVAGTYYVEAETVTNFVGTMERNSNEAGTCALRLRNITDSTTLLVGQGNRFNLNDDGGGNSEIGDFNLTNVLSGRFTIAGTKVVELQQWVTNNMVGPTTRNCRAISSGENEVYTDLKIWKTA